jgi:hypothetical protein
MDDGRWTIDDGRRRTAEGQKQQPSINGVNLREFDEICVVFGLSDERK